MIPARASTIIIHIAGWILFLTLPILFVSGRTDNSDFFLILTSSDSWLFFITYIFIFYLNAWLLLPQLYMKKRFLLYFASLLILLAAVWIVKPFDRLVSSQHPGMAVTERWQGPPPENFRKPPLRPPGEPPGPGNFLDRRPPKVDVVSIFLFIMVLAMSIAMHIRQRLRSTEKRALQAETDKANAELSFLKAQINPHFLFNTLNNIYSLAAVKSEHTAESIMKLSNIMRYVTDDAREEYVPLENEIAFISDYVDLQRLRLGDKMNVGFGVSGKIAGKKIAPLILMTSIENVFKYGISKHEPSDIDIQLSVTDDMIRFFCQNKLYETQRRAESTGIGIDNTKQRLEHLYSGKYELSIKAESGKYTVLLILQV